LLYISISLLAYLVLTLSLCVQHVTEQTMIIMLLLLLNQLRRDWLNLRH